MINPVGDEDKYRNHFKHTPVAFFNGDVVIQKRPKILLVEGEKKAIIMHKFGFSDSVAYPGLKTQEPLLAFLHDNGSTSQEIIYVPDPNTIDTIVAAGRELAKLGHTVKVVDLILKPDDFLLRYGRGRLEAAQKHARKV